VEKDTQKPAQETYLPVRENKIEDVIVFASLIYCYGLGVDEDKRL